MAFAEAFFGIGTMLGASVGGLLYDAAGFAIPFYVCGGILLSSAMLALWFFDDKNALVESANNQRNVDWMDVLRCPGIVTGLFGLTLAGTARSWYAASMEPFLFDRFGLNSAQSGLVFMAPGLTYTIFTPFFGWAIDRGFASLKVMILGNFTIMLAFTFMGPIPQFHSALGTNLYITTTSVGVQGIGTAGVFLGSLMLMMKGTSAGGLPGTEQVKGMVSSLWLLGVCLGSYLGTTLGSALFDTYSFEESTYIECMFMALASGILTAIYIKSRLRISWLSDEEEDITYTSIEEQQVNEAIRDEESVRAG